MEEKLIVRALLIIILLFIIYRQIDIRDFKMTDVLRYIVMFLSGGAAGGLYAVFIKDYVSSFFSLSTNNLVPEFLIGFVVYFIMKNLWPTKKGSDHDISSRVC